jgi:two-component system sensor histidine kinase MprB
MTLRLRTTALITLAVAVAAAGVSWAAYTASRDASMDEIDVFLARRSQGAARVVGDGLDLSGFEPPDSELPGTSGRGPELFRSDILLQVIRADGTVTSLGGSAVLPVGERDLAVAAGETETALYSVRTDDGHFRVLTTSAGEGAAVQAGRDLTEVNAVLADLRSRLILIGVATALAAGLLSWLTAGRALRPVRDLTAAAEHVGATQELDAAIEVDGRDELARLAATFNRMLVALAASRDQQRRLVSDAEHELRTPLTSLRTNLEVLERRPDMPDPERAELLADVHAEMEQLSDLVANLVDLAADRSVEEPVVSVRLDTIVTEEAGRLERRSGRTVTLDAEPTAVRGRAGRLRRAVANVLDNADKWSPPGAPIMVVVAAGRITVVDTGPGIEPEERERVFDRFYRTPQARSTPGSGLGLAIVSDVAAAHGGRAWVEDGPDGGSAVSIEIPPAGRG